MNNIIAGFPSWMNHRFPSVLHPGMDGWLDHQPQTDVVEGG